MTICIAFLRGINVGGKNKIKMTELKEMFEEIGLVGVETYIQSGNIIFESDEAEDKLQEKIETGLQNKFGFPISVVLRTAAELKMLINGCLFTRIEVNEAEASNTEGESLYVSLLSEAPSQEKLQVLSKYKSESDEYRIRNRDIYLLFRHSVRNSRLANNVQKLDQHATVRNWKTINKIQSLVDARLDS